MKRTTHIQPHSVLQENRADGTILLTSQQKLGPVVNTVGDWLHKWSAEAPDRVFLAERSGAGWRKERYGTVLEQVRAIASCLLARGMGPKTPILIMSGNGIDHGLLALAAQYIGVPIVPVVEQYSLIPQAHGRLLQVIKLVNPKMAYIVDAERYKSALELDGLKDIEIVASQIGTFLDDRNITPFSQLLSGDNSVDIDTVFAKLTPDNVAKILMTSGSTSEPKGVVTTHRMMCTNQTQIADALPFLSQRPPRVVDWLPWNHVFGGSHNFNMMLANGGSFYIDDGKPVAGKFERTLENLSMVTGTLCFNVPAGFQMLLTALQKDTQFVQRFFADLDLIFYAGASLPQDVWQGFEDMAMSIKGEIPLMTSSWGLTETAPSALMQQEPTERSGVVGVPLTGLVAKLIPDDVMRCEIRVKGANITPGYFNAPDKTKDAFDDEGFFITGDAMRFVDPNDANKGLKFDGRMSEDFKLLTGTWVRAGQLRLDMLSCLSPLASDLVVTGADLDQIGLLIVPNKAYLEHLGYSTEDLGGALCDEKLLDDIRRRLTEHSKVGDSSSTRVGRALVMTEPPSIADSEITAKGNLNFKKILVRRAALVSRLYDDNDLAIAKI
jgi:feruloyl-CoA synthase